MTAVITANNPRGRDNVAPPPAVKPNGEGYQWRMFFDGDRSIADADTLAELLDILIPGYLQAPESDRLYERIAFAKQIQVAARAEVIARLDEGDVQGLEEWEMNLLAWEKYGDPWGWGDGSGEVKESKAFFQFDEDEEDQMPEEPDLWKSASPLVLLDIHYAPYAEIPPPLSSYGDYQYVPNIIWLETMGEEEFLNSLTRIGYITFGTPAAATHIAPDAIDDES